MSMYFIFFHFLMNFFFLDQWSEGIQNNETDVKKYTSA